MRSLFRFFVKNHVIFLFIALEIFSFVLIFNYNNYQKVQFLNTSNQVTSSVYATFSRITNYFRLTTVNEQLAIENAGLKNELSKYRQYFDNIDTTTGYKGLDPSIYKFIPARVINNSVNKQYNYFTLNKGRRQGVAPDQGIISENGVVGIINSVSDSYSTGISLLNKRLKISAKLKKNNYFGSISWEGPSYRYIQMNEIPPHVELLYGDTIVTSGSSAYFPEGIMIGTIESYEIKGGDSFYTIRVKLAVDFQSITFVDIIENFDKTEIKMLESRTKDGQGFN
jgi:rod shape-determining protein MreC